eukprot:16629-Heterococcus_DN1.PRE.3
MHDCVQHHDTSRVHEHPTCLHPLLRTELPALMCGVGLACRRPVDSARPRLQLCLYAACDTPN